MGKSFNTPTKKYSCDVCGEKCGKGTPMHGCRICDWDACSPCFVQKDLANSGGRKKTTVQEYLRCANGKDGACFTGKRRLPCTVPATAGTDHATLMCMSA